MATTTPAKYELDSDGTVIAQNNSANSMDSMPASTPILTRSATIVPVDSVAVDEINEKY